MNNKRDGQQKKSKWTEAADAYVRACLAVLESGDEALRERMMDALQRLEAINRDLPLVRQDDEEG